MAAYTPLVQADLTSTTFAGTTWTDITRFVRMVDGFEVDNWKQDEQSDVNPSTVTLVLDNGLVAGDPVAPNAGRFTPGLGTSPWSGKLITGTHIRISVTVGGTTYQLFDGFATDWIADTDDGSFPRVTVPLTDILGWYGARQPLRDIATEEMSVDAPVALYPLNGGDDKVTSAGDVTGKQLPLTIGYTKAGIGSYDFSAGEIVGDAVTGTLLLNTELSSASADDLKGYYLSMPAPTVSGTTGLAVAFKVDPNLVPAMQRHSGGGSFLAVPLAVYVAGGQVIGGIGLWYDSIAAKLRVVWMTQDTAGNVTYFINNTADVNDGALHHAMVTTGTAPNFEIYVDGVPMGGLGTLSMPSTVNATLYIGATANAFYSNSTPPFRGSIGFVGVYSAAPSAARALAHATAVRTAFAGEATDTRITRLASYRPNTGTILDTGQGKMGLQDLAGKSWATALLEVAQVEGGMVYADGQGRVALRSRSRLRNPVSVATFDAEADVNPDYTVRTDSGLTVNGMTVSRPGGTDQRVVDLTSQAGPLGVHETTATMVAYTDRDAKDLAGWTVANGKLAPLRTPTHSIDVLTCSVAQAQAALARLPLDRISPSNLPSWAPAVDGLIEGRTITIGQAQFDVSFFTAPVPRRTLRADAVASANTKLDNGLVISW